MKLWLAKQLHCAVGIRSVRGTGDILPQHFEHTRSVTSLDVQCCMCTTLTGSTMESHCMLTTPLLIRVGIAIISHEYIIYQEPMALVKSLPFTEVLNFHLRLMTIDVGTPILLRESSTTTPGP